MKDHYRFYYITQVVSRIGCRLILFLGSLGFLLVGISSYLGRTDTRSQVKQHSMHRITYIDLKSSPYTVRTSSFPVLNLARELILGFFYI